MPQADRKILVFMLARRGCLAYANEMIRLLPNNEIKIYASRYAQEPLPDNAQLIPTFKSSFEFLWRSCWSLPNFLWKIRQDFRQGYQIFYFPVFHHWNPAILWLAKRLGAKTILTIHDAIFHPGEWQLGQALFQKWALPLADQIITLSEHVENQLLTLSQSKTSIIPHPILLPETTLITRILPEQPRLLFLGRIAYYKGVDLLLQAVKDFTSIIQLTIAGLPMQVTPVPNTHFPIQKIERWLSEAEMLQLLEEHDILILPYREASQSGVVTLGISSAIPMVVTKVGGLSEQLAENEAVWVAPNEASIRQGIIKLIENPDLYHKIHANLVAKRAQSSQENIRRQLTLLFEELDNSCK